MNRDVLLAAAFFGFAAFLWSRQSRASSAPSSRIFNGGFFTVLETVNDAADKAMQEAEKIVEEIGSPSIDAEPATQTDPNTGLPAFTNPIPPLPAM